MKHFTFLVTALACAVSLRAWAFTGGLPDNKVMDTTPVPHAPKSLAEMKGVLSWKTLADVLTVKQKDRLVPKFSDKIVALDKSNVKLQGFMVPLETGEAQKHFMLAATAPTCEFCIPNGADSLIEIRAKKSFKYTTDPILISGKFLVLNDDPGGMFYQLVDAEPATP